MLPKFIEKYLSTFFSGEDIKPAELLAVSPSIYNKVMFSLGPGNA
jgi:hypothetical protein